MPGVERPPILVPRVVGRNIKDDPFVRAREHERREAAAAPGVIEALDRGERHAFVATDLLWLDGTPLDDIPLLERKRLLDGVLEASYLVRVDAVREGLRDPDPGHVGDAGLPRAALPRCELAGTWPGRENPDCAVSRPPEGPHGPAKAPVAAPLTRALPAGW